jgi:hypothetical protein
MGLLHNYRNNNLVILVSVKKLHFYKKNVIDEADFLYLVKIFVNIM